MLTTEDLKLIGQELGKVVEDNITPQFESINKQFEGVNKRLDKIEATMVTKEYLDEKQADLRGDIVVLMRKEDTKLKALIQTLKVRNLITEEDAHRILTMEPFPQLA